MKKVYLIILDGFGLGPAGSGNAISLAQKPFLDSLLDDAKISKLKTFGRAVGLPELQTGGSEAGHITIGAGRPITQLLTKIDDEIESGDFFKNPVLIDLFSRAQKTGRIHFVGLVSDGGIHSYLSHLFGLQKMAQQFKIPHVFIHAILDGRDVGERTAEGFLTQIENQKVGTIASLGGRFFSMDRDNNWDRVKKAYDVLFAPETVETPQSWGKYLDAFYKNSTESDYYVPPVLFSREGQIRADDVVIDFNFRSDRMRQFLSTFCDPKFKEFPRPFCLNPQNVGIFGKYSDLAQQAYAVSSDGATNTLGEVVSRAGGTQLRISETEKFNHVTFYFSGERKEEFPGEERILVPSPKCASYAEKPEMSAPEQTDAAIQAIAKKDYQLVVQNYANSDLVGHSGNIPAAVKGIESVDQCLARLVPEVLKHGYDVVITADHGNSDDMLAEMAAAHTKRPAPFIVIHPDGTRPSLKPEGTLADIAPTVLDLLEIKKPVEMTGNSLLKR